MRWYRDNKLDAPAWLTEASGRGEHPDALRTRHEAELRGQHRGFLWAHWDGTRETEDVIQNETKATIRCIPFDRPKEAGKCMVTGKPSAGRVVFARAY